MSDAPAAESVPSHRYTAELAGLIERRWQERWERDGTYHAPNPVGDLAGPVPEDKLFVQDMFPYPSGSGLHVGHPLGFIGTDVYARYHRMNGRNVLHTMGFDAFGLPAEQYAVRTGQHPRKTTEDNINTYLRQIRRLGLGHDERRRISTIDPDYYRWTQWIFLRIFNSWFDTRAGKARPIAELEAEFASGARATPDGRAWSALSAAERQAVLNEYRLVYLSDAPVNWVPGLGTVVANEEVTSDGRSERGNFPVFRKNLRQWMMRITAYADRLIDDLDRLDWPDKIKTMQRNWIGRSHGARVRFAVEGAEPIEVFTTRADTLFGATFVVLAPEHPLVDRITTDEQRAAVADYRRAASMKSDVDRQENREKTGVPTGAHAVNPVTGEAIPVWIADYVLMGYGTGAVMAVPGHDQRDHEFARAFGLPIVRVIEGGDDADGAYVGDGKLVNSGFLDGMGVEEAKVAIARWLTEHGHGEATVQYKLRDWLFSRQRYWGEPFPVVYDEDGNPVALPESMLPVELPEVDDYSPATFDPEDADTEPTPPLSRAADWVEVELDLGDGRRKYRRDTNTMPNWAGSCWYQLRYVDPTDSERFCEPENERYWLGPRGEGDPGGVDLYIGGVEHGVLHLLYSRFWQKVLYDLGEVSAEEPYRRLFNQGYIQASAYSDERGVYVEAAEVVERDGRFFHGDQEVRQEFGKMGKSLRNAITPDEICDAYGADTFRLYEMSMGPMDVSRPWATKDVVGAQRFLQRLWRNVVDEETGAVRVVDTEPDDTTLRLLHKTIAGVREDYANLRYNTAGAKLIELNNHITKNLGDGCPRPVAEAVVQMIAPLCPHIAEELWEKLGGGTPLAHGPFPEADERYLVEDSVEYPIQVNGKVRSRVTVPAAAGQDEIKAAALADEKVVELVAGGTPKKVIVVPGRLVNIVL